MYEDKKILVIEFDDSVRKTVVELLARSFNFSRANIFEATNAIKAIDKLKERKFDFMITGNRLDSHKRNTLNGVNLIASAKGSQSWIKIIMISGGEQPFLPKGTVFLAKPFAYEDLAAAFEKL